MTIVLQTPSDSVNPLGHVCPSCQSSAVRLFHEKDNVPVHSVMNIATRKEALNFPRGEIRLGFCSDCGFIFNTAFDLSLMGYSSDCEESQGYSPTFTAFLRKLAEDLVDRYDLRRKKILEIGCGKGEFLELICELGDNRGIGFDPAYVEGRSTVSDKGKVTVIKDYYSEKYSNQTADAIFCRMTLEHIPETARLVRTVRKAVGGDSGTLVFFQVPDVTRILTDCAFEDVYYEHCSYFSPGSLARLFVRNGFEVLEARTDYDGQYIMLEAKPAPGKSDEPLAIAQDFKEIEKYVDQFSQRYAEKISYWSKVLAKVQTQGKKAVLWGSGSKGVAFLTALNVGSQVEYVVDINPHRQGTYMAATGQLVVAPEFLKEYLPDAVIIMNAVYLEEIKRDLDKMGLKPEILTL